LVLLPSGATRFPYTTLFRSGVAVVRLGAGSVVPANLGPAAIVGNDVHRVALGRRADNLAVLTPAVHNLGVVNNDIALHVVLFFGGPLRALGLAGAVPATGLDGAAERGPSAGNAGRVATAARCPFPVHDIPKAVLPVVVELISDTGHAVQLRGGDRVAATVRVGA